MANISYQLDRNATISKILNGDIPSAMMPDDSIVLVDDDTLRIYLHLVSGLLFNTLPEGAPEEMSNNRIQIFDSIMECINANRCGRLYKLTETLNDALKEYQVDTKMWPNTKIRNNVFSFINDFWIWDGEQRNQLMVVVEVDLDAIAAQQQAELAQDMEQPATPVEGEIKSE